MSVVDLFQLWPLSVRPAKCISALIPSSWKDVKCGDLHYGRHTYDYQEGDPGFWCWDRLRVIAGNGEQQPASIMHWYLCSRDLIHGTSLAGIWMRLQLLVTSRTKSLHLSERERKIVLDRFQNSIRTEHIDKHSSELIVSNIELFLNTVRFYDRQFITRNKVHSDPGKVWCTANDYSQPRPIQPTVFHLWFLCRSIKPIAGYFRRPGEKDSGITAQGIHSAFFFSAIDTAKEKIFDPTKSGKPGCVWTGFKYPQHFTRFIPAKPGWHPLSTETRTSALAVLCVFP